VPLYVRKFKMRNSIMAFAKEEDGAITVDWVIMTGLIIGLCLSVMLLFKPALTTNAGYLNNNIDGMEVQTEFK